MAIAPSQKLTWGTCLFRPRAHTQTSAPGPVTKASLQDDNPNKPNDGKLTEVPLRSRAQVYTCGPGWAPGGCGEAGQAMR